ncbi:MAG: copper transporter [Syntrophomonadaceae bacterium]
MIDLKYHITSIVAVFLALGLGILIGSTIVGNDLLVEQQQKMIDQLDKEFSALREQERLLTEADKFKSIIISNYENYSQAILPVLVQDRLKGMQVAVVVSGDSDIPAGMVNALSLAGAEIVSKTVVLSNINLADANIRDKVSLFFQLGADTDRDSMRRVIAQEVAGILSNNPKPETVSFLQENGLVKFSGNNMVPIDAVILVGGSNSPANNHAQSFDLGLIEKMTNEGIKVFGVESSDVKYSFIIDYQTTNISTVDNIDLSPGQISLVFALDGEAGHYGIKPTAHKFVPSLPVDTIRRS